MSVNIPKTIYWIIQRVRKEPVFEKLKWLESTQWWSREEIEQLQLRKLKEILKYALDNIPYYQQTLKSYSDLIHNLQSVSELSSLPLLTKQQIRDNFYLLQNPMFQGRTKTESTSGSTGDPMQFIHDRNAGAFARALSYREHKWYDLNVGDREARFYGIPMDFNAKLKEKVKDFLMNRKRFCVFDLSEESLIQYYKIINKYQPGYIYGYTSAVFEFIKFLKNHNLRFRGDFIKAIIVTSEVLVIQQREIMESYLNIPIVNEYGCSEVGIIAAECPHHGLHISAENIVVEIIKNGAPAKPGEPGEVIITGFNNFAMPLIRYKVGDVAIISDKSCSCGRALPLLENIEGRVNNMVVTPEGKISSGLIFYYISRSLIENNGGVKKFKVIQDRIDRITFQIVKDKNFNEENLRALVRKTHEYLSPNIHVDFEFFSELPHRTDGKIIHFVSKLQPSNF
ncbi:MAG: phenylacetate--CoA ligase family protein [Candidatus Hodarchaeota archaeon]